jgi:hypothetical protein
VSLTQVGILVATLLVLGIAGLCLSTKLDNRSRPWVRWISWLGISTAVVGFLSGHVLGMIWDGAFPQTEFRLLFRDGNGKPIPGVELRVENRSGSTFFHYPVTDYLPEQIPTSDKDGVMVFHHVSRGIEFGGQCSHFLFVVPVGECASPQYICRFLRQGKELSRVPYQDLKNDRGITTTRVNRQWKWSDWPYRSFLEFNKKHGSIDGFELSRFNLNRNGRLDREETVAFNAAMWEIARFETAQRSSPTGLPADEDLEFFLVEKTISVALAD